MWQRYAWTILFVCCISGTLRAQSQTPALLNDVSVAESGGVRINAIQVLKRQGTAPARGQASPHTRIDLWLTRDTAGATGYYIVTFQELEPIEDNTGKRLSPEARRSTMRFLNRDYQTTRHKTRGNKTGPTISLMLDPPAREATAIKSLRGRAVVHTCSRLKFDDFSSLANGKPLEHPQLADIEIRPTLKFENGQTTVTLDLPGGHERLAEWGLGRRRNLLVPSSSQVEPQDNGHVFATKSYQGDQTQNAFLGIMLKMPSDTITYEVDFHNIELP